MPNVDAKAILEMSVRPSQQGTVIFTIRTTNGEQHFTIPGTEIMTIIARLLAAASSLPVGTLTDRPAIVAPFFGVSIDHKGSVSVGLGPTPRQSIGFSLTAEVASELAESLQKAVAEIANPQPDRRH